MDGQDIYSAFFGQSSFAYRSIVHSVCAVKIEKGLPLDVLAPLGCGIQTGAGTILNILKPTVGSSLVIFGAGAVGLAGVMAAARFTPASVIIAVDIVDAKLELAKELGATHAINSKGVNVVDEIKSLTNGDGADFAYDATGNIQAIQNMIEAAASNAVIATVGSPSRGQKVFIEPATWLQRGISYVGSCQGSAVPQQVIHFHTISPSGTTF
jgi:aryl-alcohol dehydrogenase